MEPERYSYSLLDESQAENIAIQNQASSNPEKDYKVEIGTAMFSKSLKSKMFQYLSFRENTTQDHLGSGALSITLCPLYTKSVLINSIFVEEKYRRRGVGKLIISELKKISSDEKLNLWFSGVFYSNAPSHKLMSYAGLRRHMETIDFPVLNSMPNHSKNLEKFIK